MSTSDIVSILLNVTEIPHNNNNETHDVVDLNITSVSEAKAIISTHQFWELDVYLSRSNNSNITELFEKTQIFSVEYQIFVAVVLFIFAFGNILMALAPVISKKLRKARATVLLTFLSTLDLLSCIGAIGENINYAKRPFINYQWQMKCFYIRLPYHLFSFWAPLILLLIGLERITLLKFPFFYKFHVRKRNLLAAAFACILIPVTILAISYGVLNAQPKRIPMCHNTFALQVQIADIGTFYHSTIYALVAITYVIFGVLMRQHYHKINNNRTLKGFPKSHTTALRNASIKTIESQNSISMDSSERRTSRKCNKTSVGNNTSSSQSLMKALILVSCIYIFSWVISLVVLLITIGISIDNVEELKMVLYVSPILYLNHGCNFFVFSWASQSYFDAYKTLMSRIFSTIAQLLKCGRKSTEII